MSSEDSYPEGVTDPRQGMERSAIPAPHGEIWKPRRGDRAKGIREASCCHTHFIPQTSAFLLLTSYIFHLTSSI